MLVNLVIGRRMVLQCVPYALLGLFLIALDWQIAHNASTRGQLKLRALLMSRSVKVSENSFVKKLQTINTFFYECSLHFSFRFFLLEFDLWLTDRTSIVYTQFHTRMSYNFFLTSLWFQKDNSSETFIISIKNGQNESEIEIWINTNISLSTKRWDKACFDNIRKILITKIEAKENIYFYLFTGIWISMHIGNKMDGITWFLALIIRNWNYILTTN